MIKLVRVDDRLVHGQVVMQWAARYGVRAIVVANDMVAADPVRTMAAKMAAPTGVKVVVKTVQDAVRVLRDPKGANMKIMVIVNRPHDAYQVCVGTQAVERVNLGNYGRRLVGTGGETDAEEMEVVAKDVLLTRADRGYVNQILDMGIPVDAQNTPQSARNEVGYFSL